MRPTRLLPLTFILSLLSCTWAEESKPREDFHWDGSRTTPVHNFAMYDEEGQQIVPEYEMAMPMSSKNTCGTCHTYSTVADGWHFNASKGTSKPGRPGEPWVWVDADTGTQLPISYRDWPGMYKPEAVGVTPWQFTKLFGRHMPGGDVAEPSDTTADDKARWDISGKLEVNCMACHNGSTVQDHSEWALQVERENFRWAGTSAAGLGTVNGMASRLRDSWIIGDGKNPDDSEFAVAPTVDYHDHKFDANHKTVFDVRHKPPDQNCLQCHSASPAHAEKWKMDGDVHSAVGIKCADCHRNGLDHMIVRGYEGEAKERNLASVAEFSCAGCHGGIDNGSMSASARMGAPIPAHAGMPPVHFEKMECTVCHSGPLPSKQMEQVRLSRANRLGIHGRAQWFTESPHIVEPVFVRGANGKIGPHRMMWPAFWAKTQDNGKDEPKLVPLPPTEVAKVGKGILDAEEEIVKILQTLADDPDATGTPVLLANKKMFARAKEGGLSVSEYKGKAVTDLVWSRDTTESLFHVIPDFNPHAESDPEVEKQLLRVLQLLEKAITPASPVVLVGNKSYGITLDGTLSTTDTATSVTSPQLAKIVDGAVQPLVERPAVDSFAETAGTEFNLSESEVAHVLKRLNEAETEGAVAAEHVYVGMGRAFRLKGDKLEPFDHAAAMPVSWPLGHDVRPAAQSLGIKSCAECHSAEAAYLFGDVTATGPFMTAATVTKPQHSFQALDENFHKLFGDSFQVRATFKTAMFVIAGLLGLLLLVFAMLGIRRLTQYIARRN